MWHEFSLIIGSLLFNSVCNSMSIHTNKGMSKTSLTLIEKYSFFELSMHSDSQFIVTYSRELLFLSCGMYLSQLGGYKRLFSGIHSLHPQTASNPHIQSIAEIVLKFQPNSYSFIFVNYTRFATVSMHAFECK